MRNGKGAKKKKRIKNDANKEMEKARQEIYKILGNLIEDRQFVSYINQEFDGYFNVERLPTIEEARLAYKCILQYRRIFLKEEIKRRLG